MAEHAAPVNWLHRWQETQPVRLYLYGISVPVLGVCVAYGWMSTEQAGAWLAVAGALFGATVAGTELARRVAWAPRTVEQALHDADDVAYADGLQDGHRRAAVGMPVPEPATRELAAAPRCRSVRDRLRCTLPQHPEVVAHRYE